MRLEDADITRDDMKWDVECDECHEYVRWVGTCKVLGLRILDDGSVGFVRVRVCRVCAGRALLLPPRRPIQNDAEMSDPYIRVTQPDPHDIEEDDYGPEPPDVPPLTAA